MHGWFRVSWLFVAYYLPMNRGDLSHYAIKIFSHCYSSDFRHSGDRRAPKLINVIRFCFGHIFWPLHNLARTIIS
jgi:hypothetical protein